MLDAIILDLGNVLAFHDNELLFANMAKAFHTTPEAMRARLDGGLWDRVNRGGLPGGQLLNELNARLSGSLTPSEWLRLWNCHFTVNQPMVDVVERLIGRVKLVLLSNTHDQHVGYLRPLLPVLERFDGLTLSYEVGAVKPERVIYEHALKLAATAPERTVFFDDVARYAEAAGQVGMHGRVFTTHVEFINQLAKLGFTV